MTADVRQSIRCSTRKPRLNHDENRCARSASMGSAASGLLAQEPAAHFHQDACRRAPCSGAGTIPGAAAQPRVAGAPGSRAKVPRGRRRRPVHFLRIRRELPDQRLKKRQAAPRVQCWMRVQSFGRQAAPRNFATFGQQTMTQAAIVFLAVRVAPRGSAGDRRGPKPKSCCASLKEDRSSYPSAGVP